jgi:hypothetical protein
MTSFDVESPKMAADEPVKFDRKLPVNTRYAALCCPDIPLESICYERSAGLIILKDCNQLVPD